MVSIVDRTRALAFSHLGPRRSHSVSQAETRPLQSVPKPMDRACRSGVYGSVRILRMRVEDEERLVGVDVGVHEVADAFVRGEEVVVAAVGGVGDALLLGAVGVVLDAVTGAEARPLAEVVDVDLAGVPGHGLGEAEDVGAAGAHVREPEPQVGRELGVVPGVAADVVAPLVAGGVVGVHDVAVVPEAVPAALLHLVLVVGEEEVEVVLDLRLGARWSGPARRTACRRRPP